MTARRERTALDPQKNVLECAKPLCIPDFDCKMSQEQASDIHYLQVACFINDTWISEMRRVECTNFESLGDV